MPVNLFLLLCHCINILCYELKIRQKAWNAEKGVSEKKEKNLEKAGAAFGTHFEELRCWAAELLKVGFLQLL